MQKAWRAFAGLILGCAFTQMARADSTVVVSAGPGGGPDVEVFDAAANWQLQQSFIPYTPIFTGGVNVAVGDFFGTGAVSIVTGPGAAGAPNDEVFNSSTGALTDSFFAYNPAYTGGVNVAAGDLSGTGVDDIVAGTSSGAGAVAVFNGTGSLLSTFTPFGPTFTGGVNVATGYFSYGGAADLIVAQASGGSLVEVYSLGNLTVPLYTLNVPSLGPGLNVTAGEFQGPGSLNLIAVASAGGAGPTVDVFYPNGTLLTSFLAFSPNFTGGVRVAASDPAGGADTLIVGAGPGGAPLVEDFNALNGTLLNSFFAFDPSFTGGVFVAGKESGNPSIVVPEPADFGLLAGLVSVGALVVARRRKKI